MRRLCIVCNQERGLFQNPTLLAPRSQNSNPQNCAEYIPVVIVLCSSRWTGARHCGWVRLQAESLLWLIQNDARAGGRGREITEVLTITSLYQTPVFPPQTTRRLCDERVDHHTPFSSGHRFTGEKTSLQVGSDLLSTSQTSQEAAAL